MNRLSHSGRTLELRARPRLANGFDDNVQVVGWAQHLKLAVAAGWRSVRSMARAPSKPLRHTGLWLTPARSSPFAAAKDAWKTSARDPNSMALRAEASELSGRRFCRCPAADL